MKTPQKSPPPCRVCDRDIQSVNNEWCECSHLHCPNRSVQSSELALTYVKTKRMTSMLIGSEYEGE